MVSKDPSRIVLLFSATVEKLPSSLYATSKRTLLLVLPMSLQPKLNRSPWTHRLSVCESNPEERYIDVANWGKK